MPKEPHIACPGCGTPVPDTNSPTHDYDPERVVWLGPPTERTQCVRTWAWDAWAPITLRLGQGYTTRP